MSLGLLTTMLAWIVFTAAALGATYFRKIEIDLRQWLIIAVTYLAVVLLLLAVTIPIQFKFGAERSRVALIAVVGCAFLIAYVAAKIFQAFHVDLSAVIDRVAEMTQEYSGIPVCGSRGSYRNILQHFS